MSNSPVPTQNTPGPAAGPNPNAPVAHTVRPQAQSGDAAPAPFIVPEAQTKPSLQRVPKTGVTTVVHTPPTNTAPRTNPLSAPAEASDVAPATPVAAAASRQIASTKPPTVHEAIANAAERTSVDYEYLVAQAELESGLNPRAKARTSTATGLFQFLETTWLSTVKKHGPRFGYDSIANQIQTFSNGRPFVPDRGQRNAILALRNDPQIASLMAAGFAEDNRAQIAPVLGREPDHGELYLAHFLGAGGARKFLTALQQNPNQSAASVFPKPAAANRPIFYQGGQPRSLAGVMDLIDSKMNRALARVDSSIVNRRGNTGYTPMQVASSSFTPSRTSTNATFTPPPYVIADEAVFEPANPPVITNNAARSRTVPASSVPTVSARGASAALPPPSVSMSSMLRATFGGDGGPALATPEGAAQVKRAYDQLKAFGL